MGSLLCCGGGASADEPGQENQRGTEASSDEHRAAASPPISMSSLSIELRAPTEDSIFQTKTASHGSAETSERVRKEANRTRREKQNQDRLLRLEDPAFQQQLQALLQDASLGPIAKAVIKAFHPIYSEDLAALTEASSRADELFAEILPLTNVPTQPDYGCFQSFIFPHSWRPP